MKKTFRKFATHTSILVGSPWAFLTACGVIVAWACVGKSFGYSDTWQLVINTGTTIVTFLMVFLIQNTQNRDARAIHLKLDELIRSIKGARNSLVDLEDLSDEDLERLQKEFEALRKGQSDPQSKRVADREIELIESEAEARHAPADDGRRPPSPAEHPDDRA